MAKVLCLAWLSAALASFDPSSRRLHSFANRTDADGTNVGRSAGILYEVWHTSAAQAMKQVVQKGGRPLTVETVIRSNGTLTLNDVYGPYGISADIYNVQPTLGFYCLYRKRPNDTHPPVDDCDNITGTATAHANMLIQAGFDYVVADVTNWPQVDVPTDIAVLRPTEVLFEEWAALRQKGVKTPSIRSGRAVLQVPELGNICSTICTINPSMTT